MKKNTLLLLFLLIIFFLFLFSFFACSSSKQTKEPTYKTNKDYTGFSDISDNYTPQEAIRNGCFVIVSDDEGDTKLEIFGENQWKTFFVNSNIGKNSFLRVAHFIGTEGYYHDLYYHEGKYYQYTKDEYGIRLEGPFKYLRALVGEDGIPRKVVTLYVLTDSTELTCKDVLWSFYSSNLETITKIPFVWLGFTTYIDKAVENQSK